MESAKNEGYDLGNNFTHRLGLGECALLEGWEEGQGKQTIIF